MTDIDPSFGYEQLQADLHTAVDENNQLRARLAEVEAERDAARKEVAEATAALTELAPYSLGAQLAAIEALVPTDWEPYVEPASNRVVVYVKECIADAEAQRAKQAHLVAELAAANQALKDVTDLLDEARQQRDKLKTDAERLARRLAGRYEETVGLRTQIEWMRPVVEAAGELVDQLGAAMPRWFVAAVEAYRAGQKAPETPLSATQPGEDGEPIPEWERDFLDAQAAAERNDEPTYPIDQVRAEVLTDPPGLDAAIEAGMQAATHADSLIGDFAAIANAIRAAAPALRAGALREAADEIEAGRELDVDTPERAATVAVLRSMADRIGGAT